MTTQGRDAILIFTKLLYITIKLEIMRILRIFFVITKMVILNVNYRVKYAKK